MLPHLYNVMKPYQIQTPKIPFPWKFHGLPQADPQSVLYQTIRWLTKPTAESQMQSKIENSTYEEKAAQRNRPTEGPTSVSLGRPCRFVMPRKTRVTWRSFKERQAVWCWRGAGGVCAGSLAVNVWRWVWCSGALPGAPHQSLPIRREPLLTHIAALQQGGPFFLLLIPLHHTTPAYLQHHSRGVSKVREPHADF